MLICSESTTGYEVQNVENVMVVTYHNSSESWQVSDLMNRVRAVSQKYKNLELILNLEELREISGIVLKSIWQLSRMLRLQGQRVRCVVQPEGLIPSLEVFAANGFVELHYSLEKVLDGAEGCETDAQQTSSWA